MPLKLSPTQVAFNARGDGKFSQPFQEQVDFLKNKLDLPTEHYDDLKKSAHDRAFVVAGATKADLLADLHDAVIKASESGKGIKWFKENFESIVQKHGWEGWTGSDTLAGRDWRARVIYQTNMQSSYNAGREAQLNDPDLLKIMPYWKYIHDDRVSHPRPLHESWNGLVLHHTDPWWKTHSPQNGYGCRCRKDPVTARQYKGHQAPDDGTYTHTDRNGNVHTLPMGVDYGFDYSPGASVKEQLNPFIENKIKSLPVKLGEAFKADIITLGTVSTARDMVLENGLKSGLKSSPVTPSSTSDEINAWLDELNSLPASEEVSLAIAEAKALLKDALSREKQ